LWVEKKMEKKCTPDRQAPAWANLNGKKKDEEEEVAEGGTGTSLVISCFNDGKLISPLTVLCLPFSWFLSRRYEMCWRSSSNEPFQVSAGWLLSIRQRFFTPHDSDPSLSNHGRVTLQVRWFLNLHPRDHFVNRSSRRLSHQPTQFI
jgi:hypothetical protein